MLRTIWAALGAVGVLLPAACGEDSAGSAAEPAVQPDGPSDVDLATADSDLGRIVVDGEGRTAYVFDEDTPNSGASACSGSCLDIWPAITTDADEPEVDGVDGTVGTI